MKKLIIFLSLFLILVLSSCGRSDYIRVDEAGFIGFRFFLFAQLGTERVQANGDAALLKDTHFSFRLFDNLLNQYVMFYRSGIEGEQLLALPMHEVTYRKKDLPLSHILVKNLYFLLQGELINPEKDDTIKNIELENNEIKAIIFQYGDWDLRLEVLKRDDEGRPGRIKMINGEDWMIFDIIEYHNKYFTVDLRGYRHYNVYDQKPFLNWIGEVYGGQ